MSKAADLINKVDSAYTQNQIEEAVPTRRVSFAGGRKHVKLDCPDGMRLEGNTCVKMTATEIIRARQGARKAARSRRAEQPLINQVRTRTLRMRKAAGY